MSIRDIVADVDRWRAEGEDIALATVVETWGSGPRGPGAKMALTADARITGSVSGGCVESAVVEAGREVLRTGEPKLLHFGVADEAAWEVGLSCGGKIEVFVERLTDSTYEPLSAALADNRAVARLTVVKGPRVGESLIIDDEEGRTGESDVLDSACEALKTGRSQRARASDGDDEFFIDVELPAPLLVMVGGVHIALSMTAMAETLGFRTVVVDPRGVFGSDERFPHVGELIREWPDDALKRLELSRFAAVATLTHDPKIDDPALEVALRSDAFYVGALGSRKTHEKRRRRLLERGVTERELERLHAPIGLSIGSRTPEEIALSVIAQVVATKNGVAS